MDSGLSSVQPMQAYQTSCTKQPALCVNGRMSRDKRMLRNFRRFRRAIKFALLWDRARAACVRGDYAKSYDLHQAIYRTYGLPMPSDRMMVDVNLAAGLVALKAGNHAIALDAARTAVRQISESEKLNPDEKDYLTFYADMVIDRCLFLMNDHAALATRPARDSALLWRENVQSRFIDDFPIDSSLSELRNNRTTRCGILRERCPHCGACGIQRMAKPFSTGLRCKHCRRKTATSLAANSLFWGVGSTLVIPVLLFASAGQLTSWVFVAGTTALIVFAAASLLIPVTKPRH